LKAKIFYPRGISKTAAIAELKEICLSIDPKVVARRTRERYARVRASTEQLVHLKLELPDGFEMAIDR
jgi:peptide deformylase